jgi:hypothetical protein
LRADEEKRFSGALTKFLEKECIIRDDVSIADEQLFHRFATFWDQAPGHFEHPALLGQFRVALTQRGFRSDSAGKHPRWLGLTVRRQGTNRTMKKERQR